MSNNNYIQNEENVSNFCQFSLIPYHENKINISRYDFCKLYNKSSRMSHINLLDDHVFHISKSGPTKGQIAKIKCQTVNLHKNLDALILKLYNIEIYDDDYSKDIHLCHMCEYNSYIHIKDKSKTTCANPNHCYWGTSSENMMDKSEYSRKKSGVRDGSNVKKAIEKGSHISCQNYKCEWCQKELNQGDSRNYNKWHGDNCKLNPKSSRYKKI